MNSLIIMLLIAGCARTSESVTPATTPEIVEVEKVLTYENDALPIFKSRCIKCHNEKTPGRNWLKYDDAFRKRIMIRYRIKSKLMPPKPNPITDEEREILIKWVDQGALK